MAIYQIISVHPDDAFANDNLNGTIIHTDAKTTVHQNYLPKGFLGFSDIEILTCPSGYLDAGERTHFHMVEVKRLFK